MIDEHLGPPDVAETSPATWRTSPLHLVAAMAGLLALWYAAGPIRDFDSYWHVEIGRQIAATHRAWDLPSWWLGVTPPRDWVTSQWLSELGMYTATSLGGWRALILVNLALMAVLAGSLAVTLLRRQPAPIAVPVVLLVLLGTFGGIQERPQSVSLVLLPWLAAGCHRLLQGGQRPRLALVAGGSLVWAQLHGLWILAPVAFALVAAGLALDTALPRRGSARDAAASAAPALWCLLASLAGVLNPHGPGSFLLPLRFHAATGFIMEWWPTTFTFSFTLGFGLLLLATFAAWARSGAPAPRSRVLWVLAWTVFGLQSYRNVGPALLLIAPVCLEALVQAAGPRVRDHSLRTGPRESRALTAAGLAVLATGLVFAAGRAVTVDPLAATPGVRIAAWVATQPGPVRIWNSWNATGALVGLSDHRARLVVDGRADLWGAPYAERLLSAQNLGPGWAAVIDEYQPQAVVTDRDDPLVAGLQQRGWRVQLTDRHFALLLPGPASQRPAPAPTSLTEP